MTKFVQSPPAGVGAHDDRPPDGPPWTDVAWQGFVSCLLAIMAVLGHLVEYFVTPRVLLSHVVAGTLFVALTRQGVDRYPVIQTAILQEVVTYLFWLAVPNALGTVAALYCCVYLYELILGPKVITRENAQIITEDDVTNTLVEAGPHLKFDVETKDGQFRINTHLRYIVYTRETRSGDSGQFTHGVQLTDIAAVHKGYDIEISRAISAEKTNSSKCFYVSVEGQPTSITFIARDVESRDSWVTALQNLSCSNVGDVKLLWLEKACKDAGINVSNGSTQADQLERILKSAQRITDKAYLSEVLKAQTKSSKNTDSIRDTNGLNKLFDTLTFKPEIEIVYQRILQKSRAKTVLKAGHLWQFIKDEQKETKTNISVARSLMRDNETVLPSLYMTSVGFTNYMMSERNSIFSHDSCSHIYQDMTKPLSHYFINTSHNTYLTKDQLKSRSSVDMYISALKRGCKCVELDTWDGPNNEPIIYHGHTLTSKILFKDVIVAVRDHAFVVSDYPVILSFENHCSVEQQKVIASHLITILGDKLYTKPMPENEKYYPSPEDLKGYVIVKYKKLKAGQDSNESSIDDDDSSDDEIFEEEIKDVPLDDENENTEYEDENAKKKGSVKSLLDVMKGIKGKKNHDKKKEEGPKIAQELSDLVIYCQSVRFKGFEFAKERGAYYEMSSLGEKKAVKLAREEPCAFAEYNCRQLTRVYPGGGRVDSSNYDPHALWNVGCQMVALNFQTPDRSMQLNQGLFQDNGGCGYVIKPFFLRTENLNFDARGPFFNYSKLKIQVISGHQLPYSSEKHVKSDRGLQVQVRLSGVDVDCVKEKTKVVKNNGFHVIWNEVLTFKVYVPELTMVQFVVRDADTFLGQYALPLSSMQQGYRNVPLLTKASTLITQSALFVHVEKVDP